VKKFGLINLRITPENQSNSIVIATFVSIFFASFILPESQSAIARLTQARITKIKQITKIRAIIIFVNADIIEGKAFVGSVPLVDIQSHIIGKHVFNLYPSHFPQHFPE